MLHGLGIAAVVNAEVSCGENVKGLIRHPHWALIGLFAHMLGLRNLRVKLLELSHIVPMKLQGVSSVSSGSCLISQSTKLPL